MSTKPRPRVTSDSYCSTINIQYNGYHPDIDISDPCYNRSKYIGESTDVHNFLGSFFAWGVDGDVWQSSTTPCVIRDLDTMALPAIIDYFEWKMENPDEDHTSYAL